METYKRKNYFIEKTFQAKFIIKFCLLIIAACAVLSYIIYFLSTKTTTTAFENSRLVVKSTADFIFPALISASAISASLICLATILVVLFISHKIAGPIYRFNQSAKAISSGDLSAGVKIRLHDQLQPLATSLDEMVSVLRDKISEVKDIAQQLEKAKNNPQELPQKLKLLSEKLDYFKT